MTRAFALARAVACTATVFLAGCASLAPPSEPVAGLQSGADSRASSLRIAQSALASGDLEVAAQLYREILIAEPANLQAGLGLAEASFLAGQYGRADEIYRAVLGHHPGQLDAELGQARLAVRQRRLDDALRLYRDLDARHPDHPRIAAGLGATLDMQGQSALAQDIYRAAIRAHPDEAALRANLGLSLALSGKAREGVNTLLDVASLPSATPQARQNLAFAYGMLGREHDAETILQIDLPAAAVQDNLAYYRMLRKELGADAASGKRAP